MYFLVLSRTATFVMCLTLYLHFQHQETRPTPTEVNEANSFGGNLSESEAFSRVSEHIVMS